MNEAGARLRQRAALGSVRSVLAGLVIVALLGTVAAVARPEGALVITRENMLEVMKATGGKCVEGECEVETARNLGVDLFVTGTLTGVDGELFLSLKAYETRKGELLGQRRISGAREKALLEQVRPTTEELVREAFGIGKARAASAKGQSAGQLGSFGEASNDMVVQEGEQVVVKFESEPEGATVSVDGELLCQATPCRKRIASGRHEVLFQKERYSAVRLIGIATKGAVVRGTLQPKFGWLTIETDVPGISVTVDGVSAGKTPVVAREVEEGTVEVAVSDGCYARTGERLAMKAGERRTLRLAASTRIAGLKVNAVDGKGNDLEATVRVDGREVGEAGATLKVPVCSREASVRLGTEEWREELKLEEGKVTVLTARPGGWEASGNETDATRMVVIIKGHDGFLGIGRRAPIKLDVTEVTEAAYAACVAAGQCTEPDRPGDNCNWRQAGKEQHPINCVSWAQAEDYCKVQGKRLPTVEEWQIAASNGGRTRYPWGDLNPDRTRARWGSSRGGTSPVGTHPAGSTSSGLHDLSGNVWEWTADGGDVVGGSWNTDDEAQLRASRRFSNGGGLKGSLLGFRCAQ